MHPLFKSDVFKITVFVFASILIGAILTPVVYGVGRSIFESGALEGKAFLGVDLHDELKRAKLPRYFNRAMLLGALLCLWPTIRWLGARPREFLQLEPNPKRWWHFGFGFLAAAGGLLLLGWGLVNGGVFRGYPERNPLPEILFSALVSALAVGAIEEFFFRGCLLGLALRTAGRMAALIYVSAFFAAVHFLKPPDDLAMPDPVTWSSGFWLVGQIFAQFGNPVFILAEFLTLFLVGWILGATRMQTRSLWLAIGLHGGWVFGIKTFAGLTRRARGLEETLPWIGKDLKSGLCAVVMVALTGCLVGWWLRRTWPNPERHRA